MLRGLLCSKHGSRLRLRCCCDVVEKRVNNAKPNRHQQTQKTRFNLVRIRISIYIANKLCPRGDLATYDTSRDLALGALNVPHVGRQPQMTIIVGRFPPRLTTIKLAGSAKGFPTRGRRIPTLLNLKRPVAVASSDSTVRCRLDLSEPIRRRYQGVRMADMPPRPTMGKLPVSRRHRNGADSVPRLRAHHLPPMCWITSSIEAQQL